MGYTHLGKAKYQKNAIKQLYRRDYQSYSERI